MTELHARDLTELAQQLRVDAVRAAAAAESGHPTSSMSAADLMAVLFARYLRYDFGEPDHPGNDHLVFSKGHASPLLYALYRAVGVIDTDELLTFRHAGSRLEGHPTPRLPWVDVATGSLGQGLPVGVGIAQAARMAGLPCRVWVLCGDSELAEGSMWEAFEHAGYERLDNVVAIVDVNRLGQRGPTRHEWDLAAYRRRISAFDWHVIEADGHDVEAIDRAYAEALTSSGPTAILARTIKGAGVEGVADLEGMHGKPVPDAEQAIAQLGGVRDTVIRVERPPDAGAKQKQAAASTLKLPTYDVGEQVATRNAFGDALAALGTARPEIVGLDGEVADSTRMEFFADAHPDRFVQCYIAEQQMIATSIGLQAIGWVPYAATFAAFLSRAHDFIRMATVSRADLRLVGSHAGVAIGEDGPSQMGLEDIAAFRALQGSTVLYPCDANQTAALVAAMADRSGVSYLRISRGKTPVIYPPGEEFTIGGSRVLRSSPEDQVTLVAAGVTVHEAVAAADDLAADGLLARVIDLYSVKPVDEETLRTAARDTGRLITIEDHRAEGGLGDAVLDAFDDGRERPPEVVRLAVRIMPASASPDEQLAMAGIDRTAISATVRGWLVNQESEQRPSL